MPLNVKQKTSRNKKKHTPILKLRKGKNRIHPLWYDGKIIQSYANKVSTKEPDGRRETQANTTAKTTKYYFGFRVHLLADVNYELPLAFKVIPASKGEREVAEEILTESEILLKNTKAVMADKGYDQSTDSLRYGFHPKYNDNRIFRINRSEDIWIFSKVSQQSHKFEWLYNKRSAIERINDRLDRDFMFENHTIRGLEKVTLYVTMACLCILGFTYSKVKKQETEHLCSWVA